jgi:hypothetical protein
MIVITTRDRIRSVADRWAQQYPDDGDARRAKLATLDKDNATAKDVEKIIGNASWTRLGCDECGKEVGTVVQLGEEPDYESSTADVCLECLHKAAGLTKQARRATLGGGGNHV